MEITNRTVFIAGSTVIAGGRSAQPADGIEAVRIDATEAKLNPVAVPLDEYLDEVMDLLKEQPTPREIVVKAAQSLRWAERDGTYAGLLERRSAPLKNLPGR